MVDGEFEPKIIAFCCNWCSYAGADLAGVSRVQYPPNVRIVRTMCSGRIDPIIILEVLRRGADGVLVLGCHLGDCHYLEGNYQAELKMKMTRKLIEGAGIEPGRFRLEWVSASEGQRFGEVISEFTAQIKELGETPVKKNEFLASSLQAAKDAASGFRLRAIVGNERKVTVKGNAYGELKEQEDFDALISDTVKKEYMRNLVKNALKEPKSAKEVAKDLNIHPGDALQSILVLKKRGLVAMDHIDGPSPKYKAVEVN